MNRARRWIAALCVCLLLLGAFLGIVLYLGRWLVLQDPLSPAHAIVVLSGAMPDRAVEAAHLYAQNVAAQVWVSQPVSPAVELEKMHIPYVGEAFYNQRVLMANGVPADAIRVFEDPIANTEEVETRRRHMAQRERQHVPLLFSEREIVLKLRRGNPHARFDEGIAGRGNPSPSYSTG